MSIEQASRPTSLRIIEAEGKREVSLKDIELSRGSRFGFLCFSHFCGHKAPSNLKASSFRCLLHYDF